MGRFQVLFSGEVADGANETTVRQNLMRRLSLDDRKVSQLFSGRTVVVRSDLTREAADELQAELSGLGAIARIKDLAPDDKAQFKIDKHVDQTLKDITAAHRECPRCGHLQLESEFCARCGVDISTASKQKRKEDLLIEKKIREFKVQKSPAPTSGGENGATAAAVEPEGLQPIKRRVPRPAQAERSRPPVAQRRSPSMRNQAPRRDPVQRDPVRRETPAESVREESRANPFGGGFWRNVLKLGRKDERSH